ncbi:hypothetical protein [Lutibacter sp.]
MMVLPSVYGIMGLWDYGRYRICETKGIRGSFIIFVGNMIFYHHEGHEDNEKQAYIFFARSRIHSGT